MAVMERISGQLSELIENSELNSKRLDQIDRRVANIDRKIYTMDGRIADIDGRATAIESQNSLSVSKRSLVGGMHEVGRYFRSIDQRLACLEIQKNQPDAELWSNSNDQPRLNPLSSVNAGYSNEQGEFIRLRELGEKTYQRG